MADKAQAEIPIQPVDKPIICKPYDEPNDHWVYDRETGEASRAGMRRPASYWYKTERTGSAQRELFAEEERDDLPLVNLLRDDVRRWREADYRGATTVTQELLRHWARTDRPRRLFFCQREAVETIIYLAELRLPGKSCRTRLQELRGQRRRHPSPAARVSGRASMPAPPTSSRRWWTDRRDDGLAHALRRLGCKMATGSGKTVVMAMLIAWAFCNRGVNPQSRSSRTPCWSAARTSPSRSACRCSGPSTPTTTTPPSTSCP